MAAAALLFAAVSREDLAASNLDERIRHIDSNGDGAVSLDEMRSIGPLRDAATFKAHDTDGDGKLSLEEFEAMRQALVASVLP